MRTLHSLFAILSTVVFCPPQLHASVKGCEKFLTRYLPFAEIHLEGDAIPMMKGSDEALVAVYHHDYLPKRLPEYYPWMDEIEGITREHLLERELYLTKIGPVLLTKEEGNNWLILGSATRPGLQLELLKRVVQDEDHTTFSEAGRERLRNSFIADQDGSWGQERRDFDKLFFPEPKLTATSAQALVDEKVETIRPRFRIHYTSEANEPEIANVTSAYWIFRALARESLVRNRLVSVHYKVNKTLGELLTEDQIFFLCLHPELVPYWKIVSTMTPKIYRYDLTDLANSRISLPDLTLNPEADRIRFSVSRRGWEKGGDVEPLSMEMSFGTQEVHSNTDPAQRVSEIARLRALFDSEFAAYKTVLGHPDLAVPELREDARLSRMYVLPGAIHPLLIIGFYSYMHAKYHIL